MRGCRLLPLQAPEGAYLVALKGMDARRPILRPADVQAPRGQLNLVPLEIAQLGGAEPVPVGNQDHRGVAAGELVVPKPTLPNRAPPKRGQVRPPKKVAGLLAPDTSRKRSEKVARPILQALASKPTPLNGERLSWFRSDSDPAAYIFWTPGRVRN